MNAMQKQKIKQKNQLIFKLVKSLDPFNKNKNKKQILKRLQQLTHCQMKMIRNVQIDSNVFKLNINPNRKKVTFVLDNHNNNSSNKDVKRCSSNSRNENVKKGNQNKKNQRTSKNRELSYSNQNGKTVGILKGRANMNDSINQFNTVKSDIQNIKSQVWQKFNIISRQDIKQDGRKYYGQQQSNYYSTQSQTKNSEDQNQSIPQYFSQRRNEQYTYNDNYVKNNVSNSTSNSISRSAYRFEKKPQQRKSQIIKVKMTRPFSLNNNYHTNCKLNPQNVELSQSKFVQSHVSAQITSLPQNSAIKKQTIQNLDLDKELLKQSSIKTSQQQTNTDTKHLRNYRSMDNFNRNNKLCPHAYDASQLKNIYFNDHLLCKQSFARSNNSNKIDPNLQIFKSKLINNIQQSKIEQLRYVLRCKK